MKKSFLLAGGVALAMMFAACGDDSSSNAGSVDRETDKSSSSVEGSDEVSSSSEASDLPEGMKHATLDDLNKHQIIKIKGESFLLASGSKSGLLGLWTMDSDGSIVNQNLLIVKTDFNNGKVVIAPKAALMPFNSPAASEKGDKILKDLIDSKAKGLELSFVMDGKTLKYSVDGSDYSAVEAKSLDISPKYVTDAGKLAGKRLACEVSTDTTVVYSFYKGRYIMERVVKGDTVAWNAGYMDVFRDLTFLVGEFSSPDRVTSADGFGYRYYQYFGNDLKKMTDINQAAEVPCNVSDLKYTAINADSIVGKWSSFEDGNVYWKLNLEESHKYTLTADDGAKENKNGIWDVYGDQLLMDVAGCIGGDCAGGIKGPVSKLTEKGFTYNHSEKGTPAMPKVWEVPNLQ